MENGNGFEVVFDKTFVGGSLAGMTVRDERIGYPDLKTAKPAAYKWAMVASNNVVVEPCDGTRARYTVSNVRVRPVNG